MRRTPRPGTLDPDEDARLVARCLEGDRAAWEALVRRHERLVLTVAQGYRLSETDLEEVFQDVFAALLQGMGRLRDARALVRWLCSTTERIALATALRRRRERASRTSQPLVLEQLPSPDGPVGADLERAEEQALVRLAMLAMGERCRHLLTALYYEDPTPSYVELARRLGVPLGSLGPTRARCLERLREGFEAMSAPEGIKPGPAATSAARRARSGSVERRPKPGLRRSRGAGAKRSDKRP